MVMIADGGGSVRVPVNVPNPVNQPQQPASSPESDAAARARELQRQLEALLEKLREAQRQAEAARQRAIDAQKQAQKVKDQAAAAETQAQKTKDLADINKAKKAQQDAKLEDARAKSASAEANLKDKDLTLLKAQVDQKKEQQKSPDAKASPATDKKVQDAQTSRNDAKTTDDLSKLYLDSQEKESKAQDAEAKVVELTPPASKPPSVITDKERTDLSTAQTNATTLRNDANAANKKFTDAVGADAQTEFYGSPPASQTPAQPFPTVQATTPMPTDPLHSPLLQLLQVQSRPQFPTSNNGLLLAPLTPAGQNNNNTLLAPTTFPSTLAGPSSSTTVTTPVAPLSSLSLFPPKPTVVTPEVTKTLSAIADGKTVDQIAKDRNIGAEKVISEASASGIAIVSGKPDGDKQVTTVTKGGSSLSYTHDVKEKTVTVKGSIADPTAPGGKKSIEATEDSKGRYSHVTKDEKAGTTTTTTIDPQAGTRTESVVDKNGLRVDTTTSLTGAKITRPVGEREGYLDFAKAVGRTPEQLFTLNPTVDYGKPLEPGQELVVSDVTTTVKTYNKDGTTLERTVASDGTVQAVATSASGRRTVLEGKPDDKSGPGETARKAIFEDNKPLAEVAKSMGLTEDQVLAALPEGTVEVTKPTSDNGDVETRTMYDPITDRVVVESHDWQHDDITRQVVNEKSTYTVHDKDPKTNQPVAVEKSGGLAYLQKQAENKADFAASYNTQIADIDKNIRLYNRMGESTTDLRAERKALVEKQNAAKGEVTIAGAQYTAALTKNQQVVLDKQAAIAYQNHSYARPGSQEKADAAAVLDIKLAALDNVDRLVDLANKDVTLAKSGLEKQINDTAKANADTNLQTEFQKWKDDVWMWQGIDKKTADKMKAENQVPATRIFSDTKQENDVAWEAFVSQQKDMDKYGDEYLTPEERPARNAWLARNKTSDAAVASDLRYDDALSASTKAGTHLSQGDLDRLQQKKDAWVKANPTLFSENFVGPGENENQATLDALRKNVIDGQVKDLQIGADKKYTQHLQGMSATDRADPEKMKEADEEYASDNSDSNAKLKVQIKELTEQPLHDKAKVVDAYIEDWGKRNPDLKAKLDALGTDQDQRSVRAAEYRSDQINALLSPSEQGQQLQSARTMFYDVKGKLLGAGDQDSTQIQKDLDGINKGIEKHTFVRDAWGAMFGDSADDAKDYTQDQLDKSNQLRKDLADGKISVSKYASEEDALMDTYDVKSAELAQKVQDADGTWSVVDEAVRMTVTAAAGIAATIASGGNVAVGFGAAMLVSEVWDTTGDVVAAAQGRDIYADGHTSLWTLEAKAVTGNASWDDVKFTLKDEAIDAASNIVTATGVGAGIKTSAAVSTKLLAKEAFVKSEGVLNLGGRAVVGARAGITSQAVDGVGRVTVESGRVGLDGKWGTEEGNKRIGATFVSSAAGLVTAPLTGGVSGAIPLWKVAPAAASSGTTNAAANATTNAATNATTNAATSATTNAATSATTNAATSATTNAATSATTNAATSATTNAATNATTNAATNATTNAATNATTNAASNATTSTASNAAAGTQKMSYAGFSGQFVTDGVGSLGTGQLISYLNEGRGMNKGELIAASLQALPGTLNNIALHPMMAARAKAQAGNDAANQPPVPTAPRSTPDVTPVDMAPVKIDAPVNELPGLAGSDATTLKVGGVKLDDLTTGLDVQDHASKAMAPGGEVEFRVAIDTQKTVASASEGVAASGAGNTRGKTAGTGKSSSESDNDGGVRRKGDEAQETKDREEAQDAAIHVRMRAAGFDDIKIARKPNAEGEPEIVVTATKPLKERQPGDPLARPAYDGYDQRMSYLSGSEMVALYGSGTRPDPIAVAADRAVARSARIDMRLGATLRGRLNVGEYAPLASPTMQSVSSGIGTRSNLRAIATGAMDSIRFRSTVPIRDALGRELSVAVRPDEYRRTSMLQWGLSPMSRDTIFTVFAKDLIKTAKTELFGKEGTPGYGVNIRSAKDIGPAANGSGRVVELEISIKLDGEKVKLGAGEKDFFGGKASSSPDGHVKVPSSLMFDRVIEDFRIAPLLPIVKKLVGNPLPVTPSVERRSQMLLNDAVGAGDVVPTRFFEQFKKTFGDAKYRVQVVVPDRLPGFVRDPAAVAVRNFLAKPDVAGFKALVDQGHVSGDPDKALFFVPNRGGNHHRTSVPGKPLTEAFTDLTGKQRRVPNESTSNVWVIFADNRLERTLQRGIYGVKKVVYGALPSGLQRSAPSPHHLVGTGNLIDAMTGGRGRPNADFSKRLTAVAALPTLFDVGVLGTSVEFRAQLGLKEPSAAKSVKKGQTQDFRVSPDDTRTVEVPKWFPKLLDRSLNGATPVVPKGGTEQLNTFLDKLQTHLSTEDGAAVTALREKHMTGKDAAIGDGKFLRQPVAEDIVNLLAGLKPGAKPGSRPLLAGQPDEATPIAARPATPRPADLNYLEGEATVNGRPVSVRDIELAVPPDSILVMAERGNPPSAERIAADLRAAGHPEGKDVVLYLCEGGTPKKANAPAPESLARELSNKIGARVHAVDGDIVLGAKTTVEGAPVVQRPNLPLTDVSQKTPHPVVADSDFDAQQRFWLEPGGRTQEAQAPFSQKVLDQGARVGDKAIDPLHLGIEDRVVDMRPMTAENAQEVFPLLVKQLGVSPEYNALGAEGMINKWLGEIANGTRYARVIYPATGSTPASDAPIGLISVHKEALIGDSYRNTLPPELYRGSKPAGQTSKEALQARGEVWQFSTYLGANKDRYPGGVINKAARMQFMKDVMRQEEAKGAPVEAFYSRVSGGAPFVTDSNGVTTLLKGHKFNVASSFSQESQTVGRGPIAVGYEDSSPFKSADFPDGEPARHIYIYETDASLYGPEGKGTLKWRSKIEEAFDKVDGSRSLLAPMRPADLNYLEGEAMVKGQPVAARDIELAVPPDSILVMAERGNPPSAERIAADLRAKGYPEGKDVVLYLCEGGTPARANAPVPESLARELSNKIGARVHAVDGDIVLGARNTVEGAPVVQRPNLPLTDVSQKTPHPVVADADFNAQQRFWLEPGGRTQEAQAPFSQKVLDQGATVGDKSIDPLHLGIEDDAAAPLPFNRAVEMVPFDAQHARDVLPYLTKELEFSPDYMRLGPDGMAQKWIKDIKDKTRIAFVIYPPPGSAAERRPLGIIAVHKEALVGDSYKETLAPDQYGGEKTAGTLGKQDLLDRGEVWQFSTYLSEARTSSKSPESSFPGGVVNSAAKKQLMDTVLAELAERGEHIDAFYARVHAGAPEAVPALGWKAKVNENSLVSQERMAGEGPLAVVHEKGPTMSDGKVPTRYVAIFETPVGRYADDGPGTATYRSLIKAQMDKYPSDRWVGPKEWQGKPLVHRPANLNYLEGNATVNGRPVPARDIEVAVPEKAFVVMADEANVPSLERIAADMRAAGYADGQEVALYICRAGKTADPAAPVPQSLALQLSDKLGARVHAVEGTITLGEKTNLGEGHFVAAKPKLPLMDVSNGRTHANENFDAQQRYWLAPNGRGERVDAPLGAEVRNKGARVGDEPIDPLTLGIEDRAVELVRFDVQHARDVLPYLTHELRFSPEFTKLGADEMAKKWTAEIQDGSRIAYVIYPAPGSNLARRPLGIISVHRGPLVSDSFIGIRPSESYPGAKPAGELSREALGDLGQVWQFSTYLSRARTSSKSAFPGGVVNTAAKKQLMAMAVEELAQKGEHIDAFYAAVHAGAPKDVPELGWPKDANVPSLKSQERMSGEGPITVVHQKAPAGTGDADGETPTRYIAIFKTPVSRYAEGGAGTAEYRSLLDSRIAADESPQRWLGPEEWQSQPLVHRRADLNYLQGDATVNGRPVPARDIEVAVPEKAFVVMADEANVPSAERIAADMRAAGYPEGQDVALYICRAGKLVDPLAPVPQSLALQLGEKLGARVHAMEGTITLGEKIEVGKGDFATARPQLPLMDVSTGRAHAGENFDTQQRFWFAPNGRGERVDAPLGAEVRNQGARVGEGDWIDPLMLGADEPPTTSYDPPNGQTTVPGTSLVWNAKTGFYESGNPGRPSSLTDAQIASRERVVIHDGSDASPAIPRTSSPADAVPVTAPRTWSPGDPAPTLRVTAPIDATHAMSADHNNTSLGVHELVVRTGLAHNLRTAEPDAPVVIEAVVAPPHAEAFTAAVANATGRQVLYKVDGETRFDAAPTQQATRPGSVREIDGQLHLVDESGATQPLTDLASHLGPVVGIGANKVAFRLYDGVLTVPYHGTGDTPARVVASELQGSSLHRKMGVDVLDVSEHPIWDRTGLFSRGGTALGDISVKTPKFDAETPYTSYRIVDDGPLNQKTIDSVDRQLAAIERIKQQGPADSSVDRNTWVREPDLIVMPDGAVLFRDQGEGTAVLNRPYDWREETGALLALKAAAQDKLARTATTDSPQGIRAIDPDSVARESYDALARELGLTDSQADAMRGWTLAHRDAVTGFYDARLSNLKADTVLRTKARVVESGEDAHYVSAHMANLGGLNAAMNNVADAANVHFRGLTDILATQLDATGGTVVPMRTGGKELGVAVVGIDEPTLANAVDATQRQVAQYAQDHGLADIPHPKHADETGVSLRIGYTSVSPDKTLNHIFTEADQGVRRSNQHVTTDTGRAAGADRPESGAAQATPAATAAAGRRGAPAGEDSAGGATRSATQSDTPHGLTAAALPTRYASGTHEHARIDPEAVRLQEFADAAHAAGLDARQFTGLRQYGHAPRDSVTDFYDARQSGVKADTVRRLQAHVANSDDNGFYVSADIANLSGLNRAMQSRAGGSNTHFKAMASLFADELASTGATVIPLRTGGDELAAAVVGRLDEAGLRTALDAAGQRIADYAQAQGLADIPHPKRPGEKGVGMHMGYAEALPGRTLDGIFTEADLGVDASKNAAHLRIDLEGGEPVTVRTSDGEQLSASRLTVVEADGTRRSMTGAEIVARIGRDMLGRGSSADVYPFGDGQVIKIFRNSRAPDPDQSHLLLDLPEDATVHPRMALAASEVNAVRELRDAAGESGFVDVKGPFLVGDRLALVMPEHPFAGKRLELDLETRTYSGEGSELLNERTARTAGVLTDRLNAADKFPGDPQHLVEADGSAIGFDPLEVASGELARNYHEGEALKLARTGRQNAAQRPAPDTPEAGRVQFVAGPSPERVIDAGGLEISGPEGVHRTMAGAKWAAIEPMPAPFDRDGSEAATYVYAAEGGRMQVAADGSHTIPLEAILSGRQVDAFGRFVPDQTVRFRATGGGTGKQMPEGLIDLSKLGQKKDGPGQGKGAST